MSESCKEAEKAANQSGDSSLSQSAIDDLLSLGLGEVRSNELHDEEKKQSNLYIGSSYFKFRIITTCIFHTFIHYSYILLNLS